MMRHLFGLGLFAMFCAGAAAAVWILCEALRDTGVGIALAGESIAGRLKAFVARSDRHIMWRRIGAVACAFTVCGVVLVASDWWQPGRAPASAPVVWRCQEQEGLSAVCRRLRWGYETPGGQVAIEYRFKTARSFSEGLAAVCVGNSWGYIDRSGRFVIPPRFRLAGPYEGGVAAVGLDDFSIGYINTHGEFIDGPRELTHAERLPAT